MKHFAIPLRQHFTGLILATLKRAAVAHDITISHRQANGAHGVHQALVLLDGDPTHYRMVLAPADAPITLYGRPIDHAFMAPLGEVA
jgi:hypothetical protein